jgi:hypothetical protein
MPVITRSMQRTNVPVSKVSKVSNVKETKFVTSIKNLLNACSVAPSRKEKMEIAIKIYDIINADFPSILSNNLIRWVAFATTIYNKTTEFENDRKANLYADVNSELVNKHYNTYSSARNFLRFQLSYVKKHHPILLNLNNKHVLEAITNIEQLEREQLLNQAIAIARPRRNIPIVNYTGMNIIEPYDEYDGITDIWDDDTTEYDSDYEPEPDEDDEDEEFDDEEEDDDELFKKTYPYVTIRTKRNIHRVDYSGMDITEDDLGSFYVCETKWKNRTPIHSWLKYPLSQINELGDEDY